ncbi:sensor histidine kinase [Cellulomonas edaphi]|uniref:ATP-binding protein n=1 Tax=Cellulomonas edaphi TaxID=3053468 RepID=A0ABT7S4D9_9CELL|nr:ATP-binding protein [Cellulomons edaphi]MDM7830491.1 ATP-binding protein [Cellulomons edaphi]
MTELALVTAQRADDVRNDRTVLLRATAIVSTGYALGASFQSAYVYTQAIPAWTEISIWSRIGANFVAVVTLVGVLALLRVYRARSLWLLLAGSAVAAAVCSVLRWWAQTVLGVYDDPTQSVRDAELMGGFITAMISASAGSWTVVARRRARSRIRASERRAVHVELAVEALEQEEIRVRREVAEGLHGTLQAKLVLVDARLREVIEHAPTLSDEDVAALAWVREELEVARDIDVRQMSRLLYPERLELGLVPAVRALLGRLPAAIATRLTASDAVRAIDDPVAGDVSVGEKLLAVRVVEEGVTNALKHGPASLVAVTLDVVDGALVVAVQNDGELYDPLTAGIASGTARLRDRLEMVGGTLALTPGETRGARLEARIPLVGG